MSRVLLPVLLFPMFFLLASPVVADTALIASASNFLQPLRVLEERFELESGHKIELVAGSTGQLYAQIVNGAPFDVLLAADQERPRLLVENGRAVAGQHFSFASGRLALFTRRADAVMEGLPQALPDADFRRLAIAEPATAPYGAAAIQLMENAGIYEQLASRIVTGLNAAQAFAMVATGAAEYGILAYSQVLAWEGQGTWILLDNALHEPILQDAVLLERAADNAAARAFMNYLRSEEAARIIAAHGYEPGKLLPNAGR